MMLVVGFRDGNAFYRNRFVRTDGLLAGADLPGLHDAENPSHELSRPGARRALLASRG
jgi:carotenoid cleavage dioxygenase-like enzyme